MKLFLFIFALSFFCSSQPLNKLSPDHPDYFTQTFSRDEVLAAYPSAIGILGREKVEKIFNDITGSKPLAPKSMSLDQLGGFNLALLLTPPIPYFAAAFVIFDGIVLYFVAKGAYKAGKDISKGLYVITKDGIFCLKEATKGTYQALKDIAQQTTTFFKKKPQEHKK